MLVVAIEVLIGQAMSLEHERDCNRNPKRLHCPVCGNDDRFVEVMEYETHLVDADYNYLHLIEAEVGYYYCYYCGEDIGFNFRVQE
jgi:hypothetical protein